jgi:hypothetical protein
MVDTRCLEEEAAFSGSRGEGQGIGPCSAKKELWLLPQASWRGKKARCWSLLRLLTSLMVMCSAAWKSVVLRESLKFGDSESILVPLRIFEVAIKPLPLPGQA